MPARYTLSSVWVRLSIFSQLSIIQSIIQYVGLCVSSLPTPLVMIERIYILCLINIIKSEVWTITYFLRLGHETMVCAVCLSIFLFLLILYIHLKLFLLVSFTQFDWHKCNKSVSWARLFTAKVFPTHNEDKANWAVISGVARAFLINYIRYSCFQSCDNHFILIDGRTISGRIMAWAISGCILGRMAEWKHY